MRLIPDLIVLDPSDTQSLYDLTIQAYATGHSTYTRLRRKGGSLRYKPGEVKLGKGSVLAEGSDLAIVACDQVIVDEAVKAVEILKGKGIKATLIDFTQSSRSTQSFWTRFPRRPATCLSVRTPATPEASERRSQPILPQHILLRWTLSASESVSARSESLIT